MPSTTDPRLRWRVHRLNAADLDRAVDDPALAALTADGWEVVASVPLAEEVDGVERSRLVLVMRPPRPVSRDRVLALALGGVAVAVLLHALASVVG